MGLGRAGLQLSVIRDTAFSIPFRVYGIACDGTRMGGAEVLWSSLSLPELDVVENMPPQARGREPAQV